MTKLREHELKWCKIVKHRKLLKAAAGMVSNKVWLKLNRELIRLSIEY